jgi:parallel beta-helix repeat protein
MGTDANGDDGMFLEATTGGQIFECTASNNGGYGIRLFGSGHVVQRNALVSNAGGPMSIPVGNVVGPLVDELTILGNSNPAANYVH